VISAERTAVPKEWPVAGDPSTLATVKARLRSGEQLVGALVRMPCEDVVEMLAVAGMDFVLIDCEHGPADVLALRTHIALAQVHGVPVLVRPGEGEPGLVLRALDQGAQGIVAPHIESAAEARALVEMVKYPPVGRRGFATYPRAGRFGTVSAADHRDRAGEALVVAMLESPRAASIASEILGTTGIDGYLIGTADLAASTGPNDPPVTDSVATIHEQAAQVGSWRAELAGSPEDALGVLTAGGRLVVYNVAQVLMRVFADLAAPAGPDGSGGSGG
jgi:4-hydroxy-2-oxoheptanedioate aldolase